jgi:tRNA 2-thiouridine synthesizing protein A
MSDASGVVEVEAILDCSGLVCPLPVLRARKRLGALASGARLRVWATDKAALRDVPLFCSEAGHVLLEAGTASDGRHWFVIAKGVS